MAFFYFNTLIGALAQLGERLPCTQEVSGSIPLGSIAKQFAKLKMLFFENWIVFNNCNKVRNQVKTAFYFLRFASIDVGSLLTTTIG